MDAVACSTPGVNYGDDVKRFLAAINPYVRAPYGVMLVPELEPMVIAFDRRTPDRLLCGRGVFEAMVARGVPVKER